jgi:hypothetical protein
MTRKPNFKVLKIIKYLSYFFSSNLLYTNKGNWTKIQVVAFELKRRSTICDKTHLRTIMYTVH